jgi:hypothetical protein
MRNSVLALALPLFLAACGEGNSNNQERTSGDDVADQLEEAADQSAPTAERVLDEAAEQARDQETMAPAGQPGSFAQQAMEKAGEAEASASPAPPED